MRSTLSKMPAIADTKIKEMDEEAEDEDESIKKQNKALLNLHSKMTNPKVKELRFHDKSFNNNYIRDKFLDVNIKDENSMTIPRYKETTIKAFKCLQKPPEIPEYLLEKNSSRKSLIREIINTKLNKEEIMKKKFLRLSNIELKQRLEEIKKEKQIQMQKLQYNE